MKREVYMTRRPTLHDVAERAGVSIATVSFAFRQPHKVKESTRTAIVEAAQAVGYMPSASARALVRGKTGAIGLFALDRFAPVGTEADGNAASRTVGGISQEAMGADFPDDPNEDFRLFPLYHDEVQRGLETECRRRGYVVIVGEGHSTSTAADISDVAGRVDGVAVFPNTLTGEMLRRIATQIPVIELSNPIEDNGLHRVSVDNAAGMKSLTAHLIRHHGLRDIAFVGPEGFPDKEHRYKGYTDAMIEAGLAVRSIPTPDEQDPAQDVRRTIQELEARGELPQALVCSMDTEALLYMDALSRAGIDVPQQMAVTGFDGLVAGLVSRPTLTTIRQPMFSLGCAAASILIDEASARSAAPVARELPVKIVLRESCGCG
jgi:DNA-binding LacI/PurR family transcriptional regulator